MFLHCLVLCIVVSSFCMAQNIIGSLKTGRVELRLDRGSIRSSLRYGLSTPYRLTIRNSARLFHHVLFNMGDLHLVIPALNLSTLNFDNDFFC